MLCACQKPFERDCAPATAARKHKTATNAARLATATDRETVSARSPESFRGIGISKSIPPRPCIAARCEPRRPRGPQAVPKCTPVAGPLKGLFPARWQIVVLAQTLRIIVIEYGRCWNPVQPHEHVVSLA